MTPTQNRILEYFHIRGCAGTVATSFNVSCVDMERDTIFRIGDRVFGPVRRDELTQPIQRMLATRGPKIHPILEG